MRNVLKALRRNKLFIRISSWEYWPFHLFYIPVYFYWAWLCIKSRSFLFFSASNPNIENGGMLGESKFRILETIPASHKPKTKLYVYPFDVSSILDEVHAQFTYPIVVKPDIGERGWGVSKISSQDQLHEYLAATNVSVIVQEYLDLPLELGVFYHRMPAEKKGHVTSIVEKDMLAITGDGTSTIRELIRKSPRALLQLDRMEQKFEEEFEKTLDTNQILVLEPIGNHSRGTRFINGNSNITDALTDSIDRLSQQIPSFHFGRFDLRCKDYESLESGDFKVMELNGAGSEPAHIYHPGTSIFVAYKAIFQHLNILQKVSSANHRLGIPYMTLSEGHQEWKKLKKYNRDKTTLAY